ncbi:hypothetical protein ScPMuIL_017439 [Solemya velum]
MPISRENSWTSQYNSDFGFRRNIQQAPKYPSEPSRRNNPHPRKDFLHKRPALPTTVKDRIRKDIEKAVKGYISENIPQARGFPNQQTYDDVADLMVNGRNIPLTIRDFIGKPGKEYHWSEWPEPEPETDNRRPHTSLGFVRSDLTPHGLELGRCDSPDLRNPEEDYTSGIQPWTNPDLDNKVDKMNELQRSNTFLVNSPNGRERISAYLPSRPVSVNGQRTGFDPTRHYKQTWYPTMEETGTRDRELVLEMAKRLYGKDPIPYIYGRLGNIRPKSRHMSQFSLPKPYIHEHSMFTSTMPSCAGSFVIHPDWVSERYIPTKLRSVPRARHGFTYLSR